MSVLRYQFIQKSFNTRSLSGAPFFFVKLLVTRRVVLQNFTLKIIDSLAFFHPGMHGSQNMSRHLDCLYI